MKIGIITIIDNQNYGNRLQNYAVQETFKNLNYKVETIINPQYCIKSNPISKNYIHMILNKHSRIYKLVKFWNKKDLIKNRELKNNRFLSFNKKNILFSNSRITYLSNKINIKDFNYFIVGSDQVWNPNISRASWIDFLQFAPPEKRIAYAVSIGLDEIPKWHEKQFKKYVSDMKYISVREQQAKKIIEELTDKKADVVLDPTMMLSPKQWEKISTKPIMNIPKDYILLYFLGHIDDNRKSFIENYAKEHNLSILDLNNLIDNNNIYIADPGEWVYLIANCSCLFTDSFHGCVFSIIYHKDFYVFHRMKNDGSDAGMFSRIDTLMSMFKLENRIQENNNYKKLNSITNDKFSYVDSIIQYEKKRTYELLKGVMSND